MDLYTCGCSEVLAGRNGGKLQAFDLVNMQNSLAIKACNGALLGNGGVAYVMSWAQEICVSAIEPRSCAWLV